VTQPPARNPWQSDLPRFTPRRLRARIAAWSLTKRANRLRKRGSRQAEPLYRRAVEIVEHDLPLDDPALLEPLWWLAEAALRDGEYEQAETIFRRVGGIYEGTVGTGAPAIAITQARLARAISRQGRDQEAERLLRLALPVEERTLGPRSRYVAYGLEILGDVLSRLGNFAEAEVAYRRSAAIWPGRSLLARDKPSRQSFAMLLGSLGAAISNQGRLTESETVFKESLELADRAFAPGDGARGAILRGLAWVKWRQGRVNDAERLHRQVYQISQARGEPAELAEAAEQLGVVLTELARFDEAETLYRQAIQLCESLPGQGGDATDLRQALLVLAELKLRLGRYAEADALAARVVGLITAQTGSEEPELAFALETLAEGRDGLGRCHEAHELLLRALSIARAADDHAAIAAVLYSIGYFGQTHEGLYGEAEISFREALRIREEERGLDHPGVADILVGLADLYRRDRISQACELYQRAVNIYDAWFGVDAHNTADTLVDLAELVVDQGDLTQGAAILERAQAMVEVALGKVHPELAYVLDGIGHLHAHAGRIDTAVATFERSLIITESAFGPEHPRLAESLDRYADAMRQAGCIAEAEALKARADRIRVSHLRFEPAVN
jgi:tetratricopeptide (TPR) repeat protein